MQVSGALLCRMIFTAFYRYKAAVILKTTTKKSRFHFMKICFSFPKRRYQLTIEIYTEQGRTKNLPRNPQRFSTQNLDTSCTLKKTSQQIHTYTFLYVYSILQATYTISGLAFQNSLQETHNYDAIGIKTGFAEYPQTEHFSRTWLHVQ